MVVLSDEQIGALLDAGRLVPGGDPAKVSSCAYEFSPGAVLRTGGVSDKERLAREWTDGSSTPIDSYDIPPGELVWVRTREEVDMPDDVCAFWWQTNTLSKRGLMLVNMSMVEPGYRGPLACLFVNFGQHPVEIGPDSIVAKLVFMRTTKVRDPLDLVLQREKYDRRLVSAAKAAPTTFLDVGRLSQENVIHRIHDEAERAVDSASEALERDLVVAKGSLMELRNSLKKELEADSKSQITKVLGGAGVAFVLVIAAMTFVPWLQSIVKPNLSEDINNQVNRVLTERLSGSADPSEVGALQHQIDQLERELQSLRQRADEAQAGQ